MNTAPIFITGTTLTSTGTAVTGLIPLDSANAVPRYIRVTATASGYFRVGKDTTAAVAGDMMVQPGDAVHLAVPGCLWFSFISVSGSARVTVSPLEYGSWDKLTNQWALSLDFTKPALDPRITFTRASSATYTNSAGLVASTATDAPRFDYDPVTRQPKGLLIEEQRTNLLTYSEQFDNTAWTKSAATVTANATTAPDGSLTADLVDYSAGGYVNGSGTVPASATSTFSIYAKAGTSATSFRIREANYFGTNSIFNLTTGTVASGSGTIVSVGNGWYRCSLSVPYGVAQTVGSFVFDNISTGSFYIWGAQLEAGAFATSYIPTVAAQVTRAADNASMTGTNFSSWYNQTEGTIFEEADVIYTGNFQNYATYFYISDNSTSSIAIQGWEATAQIRPNMAVAGVSQLNVVSINRTSGFDKVAIAYQTDNTQFAGNGVSTTTDTVCSMPTVNKINFGATYALFNLLNGHIKRIIYWPRRLSNAELQAVTS